jgi:hypothetical protein
MNASSHKPPLGPGAKPGKQDLKCARQRKTRRIITSPQLAPQIEAVAIEAPRGHFNPTEQLFINDVAAVLAISANYPPELFSLFFDDWRRTFRKLETGLGLKRAGDEYSTDAKRTVPPEDEPGFRN